MNKVVLIGGAGVVAYLMYRQYQSAAAPESIVAAGNASNEVAPGPAQTTDTGSAESPAASSTSAGQVSALDALYQALIDATAGDSYFTGSGSARGGNVQHWNYYLAKVAGITAPDPGSIWSGADLTRDDMTAAQYWAGVAPLVAKAKGLSGIGFYGGLGLLVRRGY